MRRSTIPARQKVFRSPDQRGSQNTHFCPLAIDMRRDRCSELTWQKQNFVL
jgi:hypothetical protein